MKRVFMTLGLLCMLHKMVALPGKMIVTTWLYTTKPAAYWYHPQEAEVSQGVR